MSTTAQQAHKAITQRQAIGAALNNEFQTRQRVEALELAARQLSATSGAHHGVLSRGFLGRMRWLFTGK